MTIQMKATEQYFPVVLFIKLYKLVLTLSLWMKSQSVTIQMKPTDLYFPVVTLIIVYKVFQTFDVSCLKVSQTSHSLTGSS